MSERGEKILAEARQKQPMEELERKWSKARGRWSNHYWAAEWIDLARKRADELWKGLFVE